MNGGEQPQVPLWAEARNKQPLNVIKDVAQTLQSIEDQDRVRARQPIPTMTEATLAAEQLRLECLLRDGALTVTEFRRLQEIDFFLDAMRRRKEHGVAREGWQTERFGDD